MPPLLPSDVCISCRSCYLSPVYSPPSNDLFRTPFARDMPSHTHTYTSRSHPGASLPNRYWQNKRRSLPIRSNIYHSRRPDSRHALLPKLLTASYMMASRSPQMRQSTRDLTGPPGPEDKPLFAAVDTPTCHDRQLRKEKKKMDGGFGMGGF